jgi:hypothetical protein
MVKSAVLDKFSSDKDVYSALHKLFGLENLFSALKPTPAAVTVVPKAAVELITEGTGLDNPTIQAILDKGYALRGENSTTRVAVPANDYHAMGQLHNLASTDAGKDFDICTKTGDTISAFIPERAKYLPQIPALMKDPVKNIDEVVAIFSDGKYIISSQLVARGEGRDGKGTLRDYLSVVPVVTPGELSGQDSDFALFSPELKLIGIYSYPEVTKTGYGVTIEARAKLGPNENKTTINAFRNCTTINCEDISNIFVPINTVVVKLTGRMYEDKFELNVNAAANRLEVSTLKALGTAVNIGHDGVEFHINGEPVGGEAAVMRVLVIEEGIDPEKAESFMKRAKEERHLKIYMSKKADAEQDIIPSYGATPKSQESGFGINGDFTNSVSRAIETNDAETVETTIISELLQVQDMQNYIKEYLPDIKNTIDKLGRTLFLCRLKLDQLALTHSAAEVFSFVANIRNTYRQLGDTYLKLQNIVDDSEQEVREK